MNKLIIFDADIIPYVVCHNKKEEELKSLEDCIQLTKLFITSVLLKLEATHYTGFLTEGKESFRYKIYPEYKGQRKGIVPPYFKEVKQFLRDEYGFVSTPEVESDDLVLSLEQIEMDRSTVVIVSSDKDILNTCGQERYDPKKDQFHIYSREYAEEYFWKSMIIGDSADNIKGIPGKGVKAAEAIMSWAKKYEEEYSHKVLQEYIDYFGESKGIDEFYKNYKCLKIKTDYDFSKLYYKINKFELVEYVSS